MLSKVDPDPRKEIEVDPDLDPERGLKWIRIRPNAVDPGGSGSETLISVVTNNIPCLSKQKSRKGNFVHIVSPVYSRLLRFH